jgi:putative transposase
MYDWRKLTEAQRTELLQFRRQLSRPWHSPPHRPSPGLHRYILSSACYEHAPIIGHSRNRMDAFSDDLLNTVAPFLHSLHAWCVLPTITTWSSARRCSRNLRLH